MENKKKNQVIKIEKPHILQKAEAHSNSTKKNKSGRKKLPSDQKASETVTLKLTITEKELFLEKAGDIPLGTFLKNYLKRNTNLLG